MKAKVFLYTALVFVFGTLIYIWSEPAKVAFDGGPQIIEYFMNSVQDRFIVFPDEAARVYGKMFFSIPLGFIAIGIVFGIYSRLDAMEKKQKADVMHDEAPPEPNTDNIYVPTLPAVLAKWIDAYPIIEPMRTNKKTWKQISDYMYAHHQALPHDEDTLKKIYEAGKAGKLPI